MIYLEHNVISSPYFLYLDIRHPQLMSLFCLLLFLKSTICCCLGKDLKRIPIKIGLSFPGILKNCKQEIKLQPKKTEQTKLI